MGLPEFTIGVEEEYQVIDPETRELKSYVQEFLEESRQVLQDQVQPEFLRSQVEVGSRICRSVAEVRSELIRLRRSVSEVAEAHGLRIAAASTHPFSSWRDQQVTERDRYVQHREALADVADRLLIFGMHIHIGIEDREQRIDVMDQARYFLPHLLALSTSSPFWFGRHTKMKSYRSIVFENLPRTGPPPNFHSWSEYETFIDTLERTNCIPDATRIWWDIRPHPKFPTLEFRVTDICTKVDEAICLAALTLGIVAKLIKLRQSNQSWRRYRHHLIEENKWRAVRWGIEGKLLDFGKREEVPFPELMVELLGWIDDVVDELGIRSEIDYVHEILAHGTSADRQRRVWEETGELTAVVDRVMDETLEGC